MTDIQPPPFKLERYFAKYEFHVKYMLSCSDAEAISMKELLSLADTECQGLWSNLSLCYTESAGHPLLKDEVAKMHGVSSAESLVIVPQEGIYIAMKTMADMCKRQWPNDKPHAIVTYPGYQSLYENLQTHGCDVSKWTAKMTSSGWSFDMEEFQALLRQNTRIVVVNFPHNPTGFIPDADTWRNLVTICKERNVMMFSDEIYRFTDNDGSEPYPSASALYDNAVTLCGLSKSYGLPGLRLGWLCTKNKAMMEEMASLKDYITICASAPGEILGIIGLRNTSFLVKRTIATLKTNLDSLDEFFLKYTRYFTWYRPKAGTTTFVGLTPALMEVFGGCATRFCDQVREGCGVLLLPADLYDFQDTFVRLGFGRTNLPEVLATLEAFLNERGIQPDTTRIA